MLKKVSVAVLFFLFIVLSLSASALLVRDLNKNIVWQLKPEVNISIDNEQCFSPVGDCEHTIALTNDALPAVVGQMGLVFNSSQVVASSVLWWQWESNEFIEQSKTVVCSP